MENINHCRLSIHPSVRLSVLYVREHIVESLRVNLSVLVPYEASL